LLKGTYYHYCEIGQGTLDELLCAASMGQYFNANIRGSGSDGSFDCRTHRVPAYYAPEIHDYKCSSELTLGERSKRRLLELMNAGPFEVVRSTAVIKTDMAASSGTSGVVESLWATYSSPKDWPPLGTAVITLGVNPTVAPGLLQVGFQVSARFL
jgi:KTSC domain-containing protein